MKEFLKSIPWYVWGIIALLVTWFLWVYILPWIEGKFSSGSDLSAQEKLKSEGIQPTLTSDQAGGIADSIYSDCNTVWSNNNSDLESQFGLMQNDADFYLVKSKFGVKTWGFLGLVLAGQGDMIAFLHAFLAADEISKLNNILTANGCTVQI